MNIKIKKLHIHTFVADRVLDLSFYYLGNYIWK